MPCFGAGWIRIIWPDPDPLQKALIRIRVGKKIVINYETEKSTKFIRIKFFKKRNHLFSLIYVNNELINQKKKTSIMSFIQVQIADTYIISVSKPPEGVDRCLSAKLTPRVVGQEFQSLQGGKGEKVCIYL